MRTEIGTDSSTCISSGEALLATPQVAPDAAPVEAREAPPASKQPQILEPQILDEAIIEEVSIDGMCGVY